MNWLTILVLTVCFTGAAMIQARTIPGRRWVALLIWLFIGFLVYRWAVYRGAWMEILIAAASAAVLFVAWWFLKGRELPTPKDEIRVWTEEDPF